MGVANIVFKLGDMKNDMGWAVGGSVSRYAVGPIFCHNLKGSEKTFRKFVSGF